MLQVLAAGFIRINVQAGNENAQQIVPVASAKTCCNEVSCCARHSFCDNLKIYHYEQFAIA